MVPAMTSRTIPALLAVLLPLMSSATAAMAAPAKTVKEAPVTVESLLAGAQAATAKGDIDLAVRLAQSAIVADPARPTSYVALGNVYAQSGQGDYARSYYDAALDIDPVNPSALKAISALDHNRSETTANAH
jgi:Flp pilus assembly protein TadD